MAVDFSRKPAGFNTAKKARQYEELAAALLRNGDAVCRHLLGDAGRKINGEWRVGSIHGERGQSMGVNLKTGVWKDFDAGEGGADLLALWALKKGVSMHEAYDDAEAWLGSEAPQREKAKPSWTAMPTKPSAPAPDGDELWWRRVAATKKWEYFDANGELWVTVCRFDRPGEKVIRPWDHKRSDWKWPEGIRPLFNLHKIRTSPDPIILVEGEKCADRLNDMGYTATTMPGGANAARVIDWTPLRGRSVIRWADNDHPLPDRAVAQEKWVETTRSHLEAVDVRAVRDVALPGQAKPDGWDCADATDVEIDELLEAARLSTPVFEGRGPFSVLDWDVGSLYQGDAPQLRWLVDGILPLGKGGLLAAQGDAGKSFVCLDLAMKICMTPPNAGNGGVWPFQAFGHDVTASGSCVLMMAEDDSGEVHRRLVSLDPDGSKRRACAGRLFIVAFPDAGGPPRLIMGDDRTVGATAEFEVIRQQLRAIKNLRLAVFDPTTPFVGGDMNKPHIAGAVATMVAQLSAETGATTICTHHMTKGDRSKPIATPEEARIAIRGAAAYVDGLRFAYAMWPEREDAAQRIVNGLGGKYERNSVYLGAIVKANFKADRAPKTFVRSDKTGLLMVRAASEISDAKKKPMPATDEALKFLYELVKLHLNKGMAAKFGPAGAPFVFYLDKSKQPKDFVPLTEDEWNRVAFDAGLSRAPNKTQVSNAAKVIVSQGPHELCPVRFTAKGFDYETR